jgi:HAD superfamily hydrolase (TIGR01549 family)
LFGTIVFFDASRLPRRDLDGVARVVTVDGVDELLATVAPHASLADFYAALVETGRAIGEMKERTLREVPTQERFRRALAGVNATGPVEQVAETMAERHMTTLAAAVTCPPDRRTLLAELAASYPIALVSNFDHGPTGRSLLDRFDLSSSFSSVRISAEIGFIKPAQEIFLAACGDLSVAASDALHVGDSFGADVEGARAAGLSALWIGTSEERPTTDAIADLSELPRWLEERYG